MATMAFVPDDRPRTARPDPDRLYGRLAIAMAITVVLGFSMQFLAGRSSFHAPWIVHAHALTFMGWTAIFVAQSTLGVRGHRALHRRLGWVAAGWVVLMIVAGWAVTIEAARTGRVPFIFRPQHMLIFNPLNVVVFAAVVASAIALRRRPGWHKRLQIGAMALLMGPAFGRLLPMPLLIPWAYEAAAGSGAIFIVIGMVADLRRDGRVHPAWWTVLAALVFSITASDLIAASPLGDALYHAATQGSPGAAIDGSAYPAPPA